MLKEYIPVEVLEQNGPPEISAAMYGTVITMMGIIIPMVYDPKRPIIGKFELPQLPLPEISRVGAMADRFCQCVEALKEMIEQREGRTPRSDEVPWYFDKALDYLVGLGMYEKFDWPATMSFAKMKELKSRKKSAFSSNK